MNLLDRPKQALDFVTDRVADPILAITAWPRRGRHAFLWTLPVSLPLLFCVVAPLLIAWVGLLNLCFAINVFRAVRDGTEVELP